MCMRDVRMPQHTIDSVAFDPLQTEYTFQSTICNEINTAGLRPGLVNHILPFYFIAVTVTVGVNISGSPRWKLKPCAGKLADGSRTSKLCRLSSG